MTPNRRRAALAVVVPLLCGGLTGLAPGAQAAAAEPRDPDQAARSFLASLLDDGLVTSGSGADRTIDFPSTLTVGRAGGPGATSQVRDAVAPRIEDYVGDGTTRSQVGPLVQALAFARVAGRFSGSDGAIGDIDVEQRLQDRLQTSGDAAGRYSDLPLPGSTPTATTMTQTDAIGLLGEDADGFESASDFLVLQQCRAGYFRASLGTTSASTCDGDRSAPSIAATARFVAVFYQDAGGSDDGIPNPYPYDDEVNAARAWLRTQQLPNGLWPAVAGGTPSLSVTADALAPGTRGIIAGSSDEAALYARALQVEDPPEQCPTAIAYDGGLVAPDPATLATLRRDGLQVADYATVIQSTAAGADLLEAADIGEEDKQVTFTGSGSNRVAVVTGLAPGQLVCVGAPLEEALPFRLGNANADGVARVPVPVPSRAATYSVVADYEVLDQIEVGGLGPVRFTVKAPKTVKVGKPATLRIAELAPQEKATVTVKGGGKTIRVVRTASGQGTLVVKVKAVGKAGKRTVTVVGARADRAGKATFKVTKPTRRG